MCGIAGIISLPNPESLEKMLRAMHHRGPDDSGMWSEGNVHLGMTRLSIQDTSKAGHQPMISDDGRHVIIFNGEIYNYQILKEQFLNQDTFISNSDTEVILKMYVKMGKAMLQHLRGMFAFTIWDRETNELFGARDRMGIKPFLYCIEDDLFIFASELKALLSSGVVKKEVNPKGLADLFLYGAVQWPDTMIKNIVSLAPASYFIYANKILNILSYWEVPTKINHTISFNEAKKNFKDIYEESVKLRMISDRKVGIFLSSGIDSVSIIANLAQQNIKNIKTFTIGFENKHKKYYSEIKTAKELSTHFGFENDAVLIGFEDVKSDFDHFIFGLDQPSLDGLNTYLVSKASKENLTVALSGLGGDELMMGYPRNLNVYNFLSRKFKTTYLSDTLVRNRLFKNKHNKYLNHINNLFGSSTNVELHYLSHRFIITPYHVNALLNNGYEISEKSIFENFYKFGKNPILNLSNKISYYELRTYMLNQLLRDMDAVSMAHSIEVRFPFLDYKLVEFLFTIPSKFKFKRGKKVNHSTNGQSYSDMGNKKILVESYRNELPEGYFSRPKQGFQLPVYEWVAKSLEKEIPVLLRENESAEYFSKEILKRKADQFENSKTLDNETFLIIVFLKWLKMIQLL
ncbi:MAG: asparagine synthase (glutamine-hydrolyzing) [Bacteroidota bacterium]